jgi:hypothetical protein
MVQAHTEHVREEHVACALHATVTHGTRETGTRIMRFAR